MGEVIMLYDSDCGFCRWSVAKVLTWDRRGRLSAVPLQDPESGPLLPGMNAEQRMSSWHLVIPGEGTYSAGGAVAPLMRLLPAGRPLAALASAFPSATERLYRWIADNRDAMGRLVGSRACAVDPQRRSAR